MILTRVPPGTTLLRFAFAFASFIIALAWSRAAFADDDGEWSSLSPPAFRSVGDVPGVTVTATEEDADGFLWVGSESALSRYDGYRFRSFVPDPQNPNSLPDSWINVVHTDRRGRVWIGTTSGGLTRYDAAHDAFVTSAAGPNTIATNTVYALADDAAGLWVGTSGGLDYRSNATGTFVHYRHDARPGSLPDFAVRALMLDDRGTLWVGTDGGLVRRDPGSGEFVSVSLAASDGVVPVWSLFEDSARRIWIGTQHHGVYVIAHNRAPAEKVRPALGGSSTALFQAETIRSICEVRPGELWFGSYDHGVFTFAPRARVLRVLQHDPAIPTTLPQNEVRSIYRDRSGSVWVGTAVGLRRADSRQDAFVTLRPASALSPGISGSDVTSLYATKSRLWLGLGDRGIDVVDAARGVFVKSGARTASFREGRVRSFAAMPGGPMFFATDRGLFRADRNGGHIRRAVMADGRRDDIESITIVDGRMWLITAADGVWTLDVAAGGRYGLPRRRQFSGLSDSHVTTVAPASPGRVWLGTFDGLNGVDLATGRAWKVRPGPGQPDRLARDFVSAILTDRLGRLWVGTTGGGIEISDPYPRAGHVHFSQLSVRQGLPSVDVDALLFDRMGRVWASTDGGLAVIDPVTLAVRTIDEADGVKPQSFYFGSAARLENGDLAFGTSGSMILVRPARLHDWTYTPPVVITDVAVGGRKLVAGAFARGDEGAPLVVPAEGNSLAVEFAALDLSAPEQNRYSYRLDGYDSGWIDTPANRRLAAYTNLPPGRYKLELRGSNRDGVWNATPRVLAIQVAAAWYQTMTCKIVEGAIVLLAIYLVVQFRTAILRRREHELEAQVSQRTTELQRLALELGESQNRFMHLAYSDALTDLPNRRRFGEAFATMIATAERNGRETALLLIDFDHFKRINDQHGHDAGDALLVEAAERLRASVRKADCVARLGGDEFAIVLADDLTTDAVDALCARIIASFARPIHFKGVSMATTPSIGVAVFPTDGQDSEALYKCADSALYEAKRAGRNTMRRFRLEFRTAQ